MNLENSGAVKSSEDFVHIMALQIVKGSKKLLRNDEKKDLAYVTDFCRKLLDFCDDPSNQERYEKNEGRSIRLMECEYEELGFTVWVKHNNIEGEFLLEEFFDENTAVVTPK